jgi:hypothetical protein
MIRLGNEDDHGDEEGDVEYHHDEDGKMEKVEKLISISADKVYLSSYLSIEVWGRWKNVLQNEEDQWQAQPRAPANHRVEDQSDVVRPKVLYLFSQQCMAKVKALDGHPRKHAHGGEVAKVTNYLVDLDRIFIEFDILNYEDERCEECYTNNIAQDNLSMETVELRDNQIYMKTMDNDMRLTAPKMVNITLIQSSENQSRDCPHPYLIQVSSEVIFFIEMVTSLALELILITKSTFSHYTSIWCLQLAEFEREKWERKQKKVWASDCEKRSGNTAQTERRGQGIQLPLLPPHTHFSVDNEDKLMLNLLHKADWWSGRI